MLIATFNSSTGWAGKTINFEDDHFVLEGHGHISAANVMKYDAKGQLTWTNDGTRAWVGSRATTTPSPQGDAAKQPQQTLRGDKDAADDDTGESAMPQTTPYAPL